MSLKSVICKLFTYLRTTVKVDGERIKADTYYKLVNGKVKEVD